MHPRYLVFALVSILLLLVMARGGHSQEYAPPEKHFRVSFTARNVEDGHRERFIVAADAYSDLQCMMSEGFKRAVQWTVEHPGWTNPRDIHCAADGEADL